MSPFCRSRKKLPDRIPLQAGTRGVEGTAVYLNERQLSGAGDNDLNVAAEGRNLAGLGRSACTSEIG